MAQKLFDKASLVMIPSQYKEGKIYNIKPEDQSNSFEFERGSAATRVNSDGLIETLHGEATNLLLQSNQFDTTWERTSVSTPTSGQTGYDGSNDAWLLEATGAASRIIQNNTTSGVQTFSCYAKAGTANYLAFYNIVSGLAPRAWFNLSNGTIENSFHNIDANIESVGNGWYRCSLTYNDTLSNVRIYVAVTAGSFSDTSSGDNIYIQDAQLESGAFATPYIETTTEAVTRPNRHDTPRLDYSGTEPSLLLEPQRSNLITTSNNSSTFIQIQNITVTDNAAIAPDNTNTAMLIESTDNNSKLVFRNFTMTAGVTYTASCYVKDINSTEFKILWYNNPIDQTDTFTSEYVGGGWTRLSSTFTATNTTSGIDSQLQFGRNFASGESLYLWGLQLEAGSYATSYIPTNGQTETRLADVCQGGGDASVFNDSEGTIYWEGRWFETTTNTAAQRSGIQVTNGSGSLISLYNNQTELTDTLTFRCWGTVGGSTARDVTLDSKPYSSKDFNKYALTYNSNNMRLFINGEFIDASPTFNCSFPSDTLNEFSFKGSNNNYKAEVETKMVAYFPEVLTDTELQQLTSNT